MEEELEDAEKYAIKAMECAKTHSNHKSIFMGMAEDELRHFEKLGEMLMAHTEVSEDMKYFISKRHSAMHKSHANVKFILSKAHE
jgi:hypothetical protein